MSFHCLIQIHTHSNVTRQKTKRTRRHTSSTLFHQSHTKISFINYFACTAQTPAAAMDDAKHNDDAPALARSAIIFNNTRVQDTLSQKERFAVAIAEKQEVITSLMSHLESTDREFTAAADRLNFVRVTVCQATVGELPEQLYTRLADYVADILDIALHKMYVDHTKAREKLMDEIRAEHRLKDIMSNDLLRCNARVDYLSPR